jgi:hypothetical protein
MKLSIKSLVSALLLCMLCIAQDKGSIRANVFREESMGLTYEFPKEFSPKIGTEMPAPFRKAKGRERFILTLWDAPQRGSALRMAFLYDTMQRSSDRTHDTIALAYLGEVRGMWRGVKGVKMEAPTKVSQPSYDYWRLDIFAPDQVPRCNSAIVVTLSDRRVLVVRAGAPSQSDLDSEVASLARMRFDKSQK